MTKFLLAVLFFVSLALYQAQEPTCVCTKIYKPVCGQKEGKFQTFANECEAKCKGFLVTREGKCFKKFQKLNACSAKCPVTIAAVCGSVNGAVAKTFVNECFAKCSDATIISKTTCSRNLGILDNVKNFFSNLKNKTKEVFTKTEQWIEDKSVKFANATQQVWHKIGEEWEKCNCEPFNDAVKWARRVAQKTSDLVNYTKTELSIIKHNTIEGFLLFKDKVIEKFKQIKNATIEGFKRFANKTKEFIQKVVRFIKNVTIEAAEWIIEEGQSLKNKTATWWHKTKKGLEECTCELVKETEEVLDEIHHAAKRAYRKFQERLEKWKDALKRNIIAIKNKGEDALRKTKTWFQELWPCICSKEYEPVCVETEDGDQATILNKCFADCKKNRLVVVGEGSCEEIEEKQKQEKEDL